MRKKLVSLILVAALFFTIPLSAFATARFDQSVFAGRDDLIVSSDAMTGQTVVVPTAYSDGKLMIPIIDSGYLVSIVDVFPWIFLTDSNDYFFLQFDYLGVGLTWADLNGIIIKVGDDRYSFSNCYTSQWVKDGRAAELIYFCAKKETSDLMAALAAHRDEDIMVRLVGSSQSIDFVLSDTAKDVILDMYDLYIAGSGEGALYDVTTVDQVAVYKNGKRIKGNITPVILDALDRALAS